MSDMADDFNAMKANAKRHRAEMLEKADTSGWTKHTEWHFSRFFQGERVEWWPSGGKAKYKGRIVYGHKKVNELISKLLKEYHDHPGQRQGKGASSARIRTLGS